MPRTSEPDESSEAPGGRWQRRALRHAAEQRRIPKHGKAYVHLVARMLAKRGRAASPATSPIGDRPVRHRRARPANG